MTLNQQKFAAAFSVFLLLFIIQAGFSINALYNLHVSHHVIEEEWDEFNRVQALEDFLDEQNVQLLDIPPGQVLLPNQRTAALQQNIYEVLHDMRREWVPRKSARTSHEKAEDAYLVNIIDPLENYLRDYDGAILNHGLTSSKAQEFSQRLSNIRRQISLLRKTDASFAQKALDQAKNARRKTLRNSLAISIILIVALILWAIYLLINLDRQTQLEIYQQKMMTAGLLAQSLAHEIRNPLGVIKGAADLLAKRQSLDKESRELAGYMVEEVARIDGLIKELLSLSRRKSEPKEDTDMGQVIRSVLDLTAGKMKQAGVSVYFNDQAQGVLCHCAPGQIRQVILNLLLNALDVSARDSTIEIATQHRDNAYIITIRDYGKGFPIKEKERIFDLFYTTKESGFGIGLAVVKRIIDEHGGLVDVQSWLGQGSLFTVELPIRP